MSDFDVEVEIGEEVPDFIVSDTCYSSRQYAGKCKGVFRDMITYVKTSTPTGK